MMGDFLDILDEHRELLSERGYDEIALGSADEPGWFMQQLERAFSECIRAFKNRGEKSDFFLTTVGFFNDEKDAVLFNFHYELDPSNKEIELKSVSAKFGDIRQLFFLPRNTYQLPYAEKIYQALNREKEMQTAKEIIGHEPVGKSLRI